MKEKNPEYVQNKRKNKKVATRCRVCGGQLLIASEIAKEMHEMCDRDNKNMYMM
tara:strand:- start:3067 stop:3228 length:162 start_codon:yes stop_codon:yes gene_type:complete